jgi:hypothetical protein
MSQKIKLLSIILFAFSFLKIHAQIPTADDLRETDSLQRRDLSIPGSRIVINSFNFDTPPQKVTAVSYNNSCLLPLNIGYLTRNNGNGSDGRIGGRMSREFKNVLELRKRTHAGNPEEAVSFSTEWLPYSLPFQAQYADNENLNGYDFFYDENTVVRVVNISDKKGKYVISGLFDGNAQIDKKNEVLIIQSGNCKYAVSLNTSLKNMAIEKKHWSLDVSGVQKIRIIVSYALLSEPDNVLVSRIKQAKAKNNIDKAYRSRMDYWNDLLRNKIPHPSNFDINHIDNKGVTAEQVRLLYYKAWVCLAQNVLSPEDDNYPYYQIVTGKASLWDEGHPLAPFSATWESFVGLQLYGYIDANVSWSCLKGILSLVDESGMLGGESLPSRKAQSGWLLYELTKDKQSLLEIYPALERYLNWRMKQPRWIYKNLTPEDEKDAEFVVSVIADMEYMVKIANVLGKNQTVAEWQKKRTDYVEQYKKWFWKTPQDLPYQHADQTQGRDGNPIMITTGLYIPEIMGDYLDGLVGMFYRYYNPDKAFAGFRAPKYPDIDFTVYGLIQNKKDLLARDMIEVNLRDVVRAQQVFAETYSGLEIPYPSGVRPSIFGIATMIDFVLLKNGYMYTKGTPCLVNLYPEEETGVTNIPYFGKQINIKNSRNGKFRLSGSAIGEEKEIVVNRGEEVFLLQ